MKMKNRFFENLGKRVSIGAVISMSDPTVCELAGDCGMDFCWIDAEHCPMTIETVRDHLLALRGTGCAGFVRVRECDPMIIKPYLDLAPDGIICPMVNTPELAEAAVAACRYPPLGIRGWGPRRGVGYGGADTQAYIKESEQISDFLRIIRAADNYGGFSVGNYVAVGQFPVKSLPQQPPFDGD